jgi:hypothetical protein
MLKLDSKTRSFKSRPALCMGGLAWILVAGCQGTFSEKPPVHWVYNMDKQAKFLPQDANPFFEDKRAMRPAVPGTVARGEVKEDRFLYQGMLGGKGADMLPLVLDEKLLARGKERYGIYCAVCHGGAGYGDGMAVQRGMLPPTSFHDARILALSVGEVFQVISNGIRNMPAYNNRIPVEDRWAIAAYVRALQISQNAGLKDVPEDVALEKGWE